MTTNANICLINTKMYVLIIKVIRKRGINPNPDYPEIEKVVQDWNP